MHECICAHVIYPCIVHIGTFVFTFPSVSFDCRWYKSDQKTGLHSLCFLHWCPMLNPEHPAHRKQKPKRKEKKKENLLPPSQCCLLLTGHAVQHVCVNNGFQCQGQWPSYRRNVHDPFKYCVESGRKLAVYSSSLARGSPHSEGVCRSIKPELSNTWCYWSKCVLVSDDNEQVLKYG